MSNFLEISEKSGFCPMGCEKGVSSLVFEKDGYVFKINRRNSLRRAESDYKKLKDISGDFPEKIVASSFFECIYNGEKYTCVKQKKIIGPSVKQMGKSKFIDFLKNNKNDQLFLKMLVGEFFVRISRKKLYPDIVGNPADQSIFNSINILLTPENGLVICDVGLSPHEDTLAKYGLDFYNSDNVAHYVKKVKETSRIILGLK